MPLALTASDYAMFDGEQAGSFTQAATSTTVPIANALGMGPVRAEVPVGDGYIYEVRQEWWLPVAELGAIAPAEGDSYTDAGGVVWWLQSDIEYNGSGLAGNGAMYRVMTRQAR